MGMLMYLPQANKEKEKEEVSGKNFRAVSCCMQGWRLKMEDAHVTYNEELFSMFAIFDGHGGQEVAKFCAEHIIQVFKDNENFKKGQIKEALVESFLKLDEMMLSEKGKLFLDKHKEEAGEESIAGCTANVAVIYKDVLYVANAGDSRSVLSEQGKAIEMSIDHKPENEEELRRIEKAGGFVSQGRVNGNLNLSRALGDFEYKQNKNLQPQDQIITGYPEVQDRKLDYEKNEFLLMGCDGIWETKSNQEMVDFVKERLQKGLENGIILEQLLDDLCAEDTMSSGGKGCDNMSGILVTFKKA